LNPSNKLWSESVFMDMKFWVG